MILVDANLIIYAIDRDSSHHKVARRWLERILSGTEEVGFAWIILLAFIRITTHARIMQKPLEPVTALEYVSSWLEQPYAVVINPTEQHWSVLKNLLETTGTAANLTSDAHLAALAIEHGASIHSADHDFKRFAGVKHVDPLGRPNDDGAE
jgi:toxin-antitoxin system PIN domain toxin